MILPFLMPRLSFSRPPVTPGSQDRGPGTYSVLIPNYDTMVVELWGPGGGGGGSTTASTAPANTYQGGSPSYCYFGAPSGTIYAFGGTGGWNCAINDDRAHATQSGSAGAHGSGSGGDVNTLAGGAAGGPGVGDADASGVPCVSGAGGYGGYVRKTWRWFDSGAPIAGQSYTMVVQGGGGGGFGNRYGGNAGGNGLGRMTWS